MAPFSEELEERTGRLGHVHGVSPFWWPGPERDRRLGCDGRSRSRTGEPFPVASMLEVRSGSGNRRARSSRGRAGKADLHASTIGAAALAAHELIFLPAAQRSEVSHAPHDLGASVVPMCQYPACRYGVEIERTGLLGIRLSWYKSVMRMVSHGLATRILALAALVIVPYAAAAWPAAASQVAAGGGKLSLTSLAFAQPDVDASGGGAVVDLSWTVKDSSSLATAISGDLKIRLAGAERAEAVWTGWADLASSELKSELGLKAVR